MEHRNGKLHMIGDYVGATEGIHSSVLLTTSRSGEV